MVDGLTSQFVGETDLWQLFGENHQGISGLPWCEIVSDEQRLKTLEQQNRFRIQGQKLQGGNSERKLTVS